MNHLDSLGPDWNEDDEPWYVPPTETGVYHGIAADEDGHLVCCGLHVLNLPSGDWQTADLQSINCFEAKP